MQIVDFDSSKISIREMQKIHSLCGQVIRWSESRDLIQFNHSKTNERLIRSIKIFSLFYGNHYTLQQARLKNEILLLRHN